MAKPPADEAPVDEAPVDETRCDACGKPLGDADRYCTHCGAPLAAPSPEHRARVRARKWRRRRRAIGTLAFLLVAAGLVAALVVVFRGDDDSDPEVASTRGGGGEATTTTVVPLAGPYEVTDGLNIRAGPGSSFASFGNIETGYSVNVMCVTDGESVNGPLGASTKWLRIEFWGPPAYVTAQYVKTGPDLQSPTIIPPCAAG